MLVLFLFGLFLLVYDLAGFYGTFFGQDGEIINSSYVRTGLTDNSAKRCGGLLIGSSPAGLSASAGPGQITPQLAFFFNQPMPINSASKEDLVLLPGIGPRLASRIILFRQQHGTITNASELAGIPGIGQKLEKKIRSMIIFDSP